MRLTLFAWFTADEEFGQNPGLCSYLEESQIPYVMAVPKSTQFTDTAGQVAQIDKIAQQLRRNNWQRRACGIGSKGHRVYDWALIDSTDPDHQYLIRRSIDDGELTFYHCYNPHRASVGELVHVAGARWPIEECFGSSKNEVGLDNYKSHLDRLASAYHPGHARPHLPRRHRTPSQQKGLQPSGQQDQPDDSPEASSAPQTAPPLHRRLIPLILAEIRRLLNLARRSDQEIRHGLHWSIFRRWHQAQARRAHIRRHLHLQILMI